MKEGIGATPPRNIVIQWDVSAVKALCLRVNVAQ